MKEFKFELGDEVKDRVSGYKGIIRVRSQYLTGCNVYGIQSQKLKDNKPFDWSYLDEDLLILIKSEKIKISEERKLRNAGGPISLNQCSPYKS